MNVFVEDRPFNISFSKKYIRKLISQRNKIFTNSTAE